MRLQAISIPTVFQHSSRGSRRSRGQSLVEFALIVPIMLVLAGGTLDLGRLFYARVSIENAAREGAFYGSMNPRCDTAARSHCDNPDTADWRVRNETTGLAGLTVNFACSDAGSPVSVTSCAAGHTYEVSVSTDFDFVTPLLVPLLGDRIVLDAKASAVVLSEAFDPDALPEPVGSLPPMCNVPDMVGMERNPAHDAWIAAGFVQQNLSWPGMSAQDIVADQSLQANTDDPCATATVTISE
jgi:Flp pilus assembly protein TadG